MAEASIQTYFLVLVVGFGAFLFVLRNERIVSNSQIKSSIRFPSREWIPAIIAAVVVVGLVVVYFDFNDQTLKEEDLVLSINYLQNITSIESAEIELDFSKKQMRYDSTFLVEGYDIILESNSRGFRDNSIECNNGLTVMYKNTEGKHLVWHNGDYVKLPQKGIIDFVEMYYVCDFEYKIEPNGQFTIHLRGIDQNSISIDKIPFTMKFNSDQYRCGEFCISSEDFELTDIERKNEVTIVKANSLNPNTKTLRIDLRTDNFAAQQMASIFFILIQVGIGATITIIVYTLTTIKQTEIRGIISRMDTRDRKEEDNKLEKKKYYEKQYVHAISGTRLQIQKILETIQKDKKITDDVKVQWRKLSTASERLRFLNTISVNILDHVFIDDLDLIKGTLEMEIPNNIDSVKTQLNYVNPLLEKAFKIDLKSQRQEVLGDELAALEKSIEKQIANGANKKLLDKEKHLLEDQLRRRYLYSDE